MSKAIPYIIQGDNITLVVDNVGHTISRQTHMNYGRILDAIKDGKWDVVKSLIDVTKSISNYVNGKLEIRNGEMYWNSRLFHNALSDRVLQMYEQGFSVDSMIAFMENLLKNPSYRAVNELYGFLEKNSLPITDDGCFLAYKRVAIVDGSMVDCYTKTIANEIGDTPTMDRNEVNDNANDTCSNGLHFCSLSYLTSSGYGRNNGTIVIVKINPQDVVSIPTDYNEQKGRCCRYEVMSVHGNDATKEAFDTPVVNIEDASSISLDKPGDQDSYGGGMFTPV